MSDSGRGFQCLLLGTQYGTPLFPTGVPPRALNNTDFEVIQNMVQILVFPLKTNRILDLGVNLFDTLLPMTLSSVYIGKDLPRVLSSLLPKGHIHAT